MTDIIITDITDNITTMTDIIITITNIWFNIMTDIIITDITDNITTMTDIIITITSIWFNIMTGIIITNIMTDIIITITDIRFNIMTGIIITMIGIIIITVIIVITGISLCLWRSCHSFQSSQGLNCLSILHMEPHPSGRTIMSLLSQKGFCGLAGLISWRSFFLSEKTDCLLDGLFPVKSLISTTVIFEASIMFFSIMNFLLSSAYLKSNANKSLSDDCTDLYDALPGDIP